MRYASAPNLKCSGNLEITEQTNEGFKYTIKSVVRPTLYGLRKESASTLQKPNQTPQNPVNFKNVEENPYRQMSIWPLCGLLLTISSNQTNAFRRSHHERWASGLIDSKRDLWL